ncbi:hypothetical protein evm_013540 [Chilo suppressalis]|nr:hypothetical protein evm_013540 [Chilo suppressalis]
MDVIAKARGSNFSNNKLELLKRLIEENKEILLCKKTDTVSQAQKEKTWLHIHMEFNASSSRHRTMKQLKYKFDNMKKSARKDASRERQERRRTGGGQLPGTSSSDHPDKDWMRSLIFLSADGMEATYDDDTLPENVEPSGSGEGNCTPLAQTNIDEVMTPCVMTPPAKKKLEYIKNSEDELLPMIMTQPSCTPSPPRQLDVGTFIPLSQVESVESVKKPIIKDTGGGAPGCLLRRPVTSILKCRKNNFGASPVAVRRSIKMLSEEKLQCTKEKEKILEESNRRAEEEHIKKLDHAQELHDQLIKHNEERHHKEMLLLDLKIKIHEAQLKKLN